MSSRPLINTDLETIYQLAHGVKKKRKEKRKEKKRKKDLLRAHVSSQHLESWHTLALGRNILIWALRGALCPMGTGRKEASRGARGNQHAVLLSPAGLL